MPFRPELPYCENALDAPFRVVFHRRFLESEPRLKGFTRMQDCTFAPDGVTSSMTNIWTTRGGQLPRVAKRTLARHGIKAGIIALGALVAAGTIDRTAYLHRAPLVQRVAAG